MIYFPLPDDRPVYLILCTYVLMYSKLAITGVVDKGAGRREVCVSSFGVVLDGQCGRH